VNGSTLNPPREKDPKPTSHLFHNNRDGTFLRRHPGLPVLEFTGLGSRSNASADYDNDGFERSVRPRITERTACITTRKNGNFQGTGWPCRKSPAMAMPGAQAALSSTTIAMGKLDLLVANYVLFRLLTTVPKPGRGIIMCVWKGTPVMCGPRGLESSPQHPLSQSGRGKSSPTVSKSSGIEKNVRALLLQACPHLDYDDDRLARTST